MRAQSIPTETDILIVGGGSSGAALAGVLARDTDHQVLLLEAGPDYGALMEGRWPTDLLSARSIPPSHQWGYSGQNHPSHSEPSVYDRARVIGGCSAHNGCVALLGHRTDYDGWAAAGNDGWSWAAVAPAFERAKQALRVRIPDDQELAPFQAAFVDGAVAAGIPRVVDLNDPDDVQGVAPSPANVYEGTRWNTALAYLDPVRSRPNLTVIGNALIERVIIENARAVAVEAVVDGERMTIQAGRIILSAGAYGSPAILMRSGIGPSNELRRLGAEVLHDLPGVGRALTDHPIARFELRGSATLSHSMADFGAAHWAPDEQSLLKARSAHCRDAFDLHLFPVSFRDPLSGDWQYVIEVSNVAPLGAGRISLPSLDPEARPVIDHGYLTDVEGVDREVLLDGVELGREIVAEMVGRGLVAEELEPGVGRRTRAELARWVDETVRIYYHPACSCRMGPARDALAVVDPRGQVHGLDDLYICDASLFPTIMRANTNLPAVMLAEHMASWLGELR